MSQPVIIHKAPKYNRAAYLPFLDRCILRHQPKTLLNQLPDKTLPPYDLVDNTTLNTMFEIAFLQSGKIPTEISVLYSLYFGSKFKVYALNNS